MAIDAYVRDSRNNNAVEITPDNELLISVSHDPALRPQKRRPFRQYFTADGTSTGSNDMGVDGSVTPQVFRIKASRTDDRYISTISLIVGYGTAGQPNKWADGVALTNGTSFYYNTDEGRIDIHEGIKSNQDMFRLGHENTTTAWEVRHVNATNDYGYFITIDLTRFLPPYGIKLDAGTTQELRFEIRDSAIAADSFNAIAYGFDRFE